MKSFLCCLCVLSVSAGVHARDVDNNFTLRSTAYADGVLLMADKGASDLVVSVSGPGNLNLTQEHYGTDAIFLDVGNLNGQALEDGLYKYTVWPMPAVTYTREESAAMPGRNDLDQSAAPRAEKVSGSFRVVNGAIPDAGLIELSAHEEMGDLQ